MQDNKNVHRTDADNNNSEDDQLRPNTMNETIREVTGNPETDLSRLSAMNQQSGSGNSSDSDDVQGSDLSQGMSYNPNDATAVRSGGTTDMDDQRSGGAGLAAGERMGSGTNLTTRRSVTGSDFDGQDKTS
jgi:hypothetical protein